MSSKKELGVFILTVGDYFNSSISKVSRRVHSNLVVHGNNGVRHKYSVKTASTVYVNEMSHSRKTACKYICNLLFVKTNGKL